MYKNRGMGRGFALRSASVVNPHTDLENVLHIPEPWTIERCEFDGKREQLDVFQAVNEAVDQVRRTESKRTDDLKYTRYMWLQNENRLTKAQKDKLARLKDCELDTVKGYRMRLVLQELFRFPASLAPEVVKNWIHWGLRC